jgi:hypothetical protein
VFRIAFANHENDGRSERIRIVGESLAPTLRDQAVLTQGVDVGKKRQGDNVCFQAVDHGAGLARGAAVRLLNAPFLPGLALIFGYKLLVQVFEQFASGVVGNVENLAGFSDIGVCNDHDRR